MLDPVLIVGLVTLAFVVGFLLGGGTVAGE